MLNISKKALMKNDTTVILINNEADATLRIPKIVKLSIRNRRILDFYIRRSVFDGFPDN